MDELSNWCEIDGHRWVETHVTPDPTIKVTLIFRKCKQCQAEEQCILTEKNQKLARKNCATDSSN